MSKNRFAGMANNMKKAVEKSDLQVSKKTKDNLIEIEILNIENPPFHDRYSVDIGSIKTLAEDISIHGLINPISVRRLDAGKYQRIAGYRRIEAHKLLGKTTIKAIVFETDSDIDVIELMFSENYHRENPSEYDVVIFHLEALSYMLEKEDDELKSIISKARKVEQGSLKTDDHDLLSQIDLVKELLLKTKIFSSVNSFYQRMTNTLALHPSLIQAMQSKQIYYSIAVELNKAQNSDKTENEINEFLLSSIKENYSVSEAKLSVSIFVKPSTTKDSLEVKKIDLKYKIKQLIKKIDALDSVELDKLDTYLSSYKS